jgi:hypothetical protein
VRAAALAALLFAVGCPAPAKTVQELVDRAGADRCTKDDDCGFVAAEDQCSLIPVTEARSAEIYERAKALMKPRCFGPQMICQPKCEARKCACGNPRRGPD